MKPSEFLIVLKVLPKDFGTLRDDPYLGDDAKLFVLIFQDNPENWSVRWSIGKTLHHFGFINLVCKDGAWESIDTSLPYSIPDEDIRKKVAFYFLKKLLIDPAEYANILRGEKCIKLHGVEDRKLYEHAVKIYSTQSSFLRLQVDRAHVIVKNMLEKMEELGQPLSVLTCSGDLPDLVSEELERRRISHAVVRPKMSYPSDKKLYRDVLFGRMELSYEEVLEDANDLPEVPPDDEEFPDIKMEEMKEQARIRLIELIKSGDLLPRLERMIPPAEYKKVAHILSSTDYGPKTKAVLVKAELHSFIDQLQAKLTRRGEIGLGLVGLIAAVVGALFGFGVTLEWYRTLIVVLFGTAVFNSLLIKRFVSVLRWLLHILGFLCGFYLFGRWGMLVGVMLAASIGFFLVQREHRTTRRRGEAVREIKEILTGNT